MEKFIQQVNRAIIVVLLRTIKIYQKTLSFDHGLFAYRYPYGYCRFHPTCSEYAYQAYERYGTVKGTKMSIKRILRCNPFNKGGEDPVK